MPVRALEQIGNGLFKSQTGAMYRHKVGTRFRQVIDPETGMGKTEAYNVSEGLVRLTPRRHMLKKQLKHGKRL